MDSEPSSVREEPVPVRVPVGGELESTAIEVGDGPARTSFLHLPTEGPLRDHSSSGGSMAQTEGVEANEDSRYVDYTISTPWEQLAADFEAAMRTLLRHTLQPRAQLPGTNSVGTGSTSDASNPQVIPISSPNKAGNTSPHRIPVEYQGTTYIVRLENKTARVPNTLSMWFDSVRYFLICHAYDWITVQSPSSLKTIFSAALMALDSLVTVPAGSPKPALFYVPATYERYHRARSIVGYQLLPPPSTTVIHYECLLDDVNGSLHKHPFYHLDNVWDCFLHKLISCDRRSDRSITQQLQAVAKLEERFHRFAEIDVQEYYDYNLTEMSTAALVVVGSSGSNRADYGGSGRNGWVSMFGVLDGEYTVSTTAATSSNTQSGFTCLRGFAKYLQRGMPSGRRILHPVTSVVNKLQAKIAHKGSRKRLAVDNETDSLLQPSFASPSAFTLYAGFAPVSDATRLPTTISLSKALRSLLSCYVMGKSSRTKLMASNLFGISDQLSELFDFEKAESLASGLSPLTQSMVHAYCQDNLDDPRPPSPPYGYHSPQSASRKSSKSKQHKDINASSMTSPSSSFSSVSTSSHVALPHQTFLDVLFHTDTPDFEIETEKGADTEHRSNDSFGLSGIFQSISASLGGLPVQCPDSSLFGSLGWLNLVALYLGCLHCEGGGLRDAVVCWRQCTRKLRESWENGLPIPHLPNNNASVPSAKVTVTTVDSLNGGRLPALLAGSQQQRWLCTQPLWNDVLVRLNSQSNSFSRSAASSTGDYSNEDAEPLLPRWRVSLPNRQDNLFVQKLQLLNLCNAVKREPMTVSSDLVSVTDGISGIDIHLSNASGGHGMGSSRLMLLRRLPVTDDLETQYFRMATRLEAIAEADRETSPSRDPTTVTVKWALLMPSLTSDMKAFKAAFPASDFDVFCLWYFDDAHIQDWSDEDYSTIEDIWDHCEAQAAEDQKPLFRVETEAEKCLTYFENITPTQLFAELIAALLPAVYVLLANEVHNIVLDVLNKTAEPEAEVEYEVVELARRILKALNDLCSLMNDAGRALRVDIHNEDSEDAIGSPAVALVDRVASKMMEVEEFLLRYYAVSSLLSLDVLMSQQEAAASAVVVAEDAFRTSAWTTEVATDDAAVHRTAMSLCMNGETTARTVTEGQIYFQVALNATWGIKAPQTFLTPSGFRRWIKQSRRQVAPRRKCITITIAGGHDENKDRLATTVGDCDGERPSAEMSSITVVPPSRMHVDINKDYIRVSTNIVS